MVERKNHNQSVNTPEKIAATYLRLNGFLLLPHFTVFASAKNNHVDLIGYRPAKSEELVFGDPLKRDDDFSNKIQELLNDRAGDSPDGIIVQVRGNKTYPKFFAKHEEYVSKFLGGIKTVCVIFRLQKSPMFIRKSKLCIDLKYSYHWIQNRIKGMERDRRLKKTGSWTLSEEFLADLLSTRRIVCRDKYF